MHLPGLYIFNALFGMTNVISLSGFYVKVGRIYNNKSTNTRLILGRRTKPGLPQFYLLLLDDQDERHYFSSLYPVSGNTYRADYGGYRYTVTLEADSITLKPSQE